MESAVRQGSKYYVLMGEKIIPSGEGIERRSLDEKFTYHSDGIGLNDNSIRGLCTV